MRNRLLTAGLLAALVAGAAGAWAWPRLVPGSAAETLGSFIGDARWSEARSALPLPHRPYRGAARLDDYSRVLAALYAPIVRDDPEQPLAVAQQLVWRGGTGDVERADALLARQPDGPVVWNERALLAAARGAPVRALAELDRALAVDPALRAALFNRALVLEQVHAVGEAREAWHRFLAVEPVGAWAEEARLRLERLQHETPERVEYEEAQDELNAGLFAVRDADELRAWVAQPRVGHMLDQLAALGDRMYATEIAWLDELDAAGWEERRAVVASYPALRDAVLRGTADRAVLESRRRTEDPLLAVRTTHLAAYDALQRRDAREALALLHDMQSLCARVGCLEEAVTVGSDVGTVLHQEGDIQGAAAAFEHALRALPGAAVVRRSELLTKLARVEWAAGAPARATGLELEAARLARAAGSDIPLALALLNLGEAAERGGEPTVAAAFAREARTLAERSGPARIAQLATSLLARTLLVQGRVDEAESMLDGGWKAARAAAVPHVLATNRLELAEVRLAQRRPAEAAALLREVAAAEDVIEYEDQLRVRRLRAQTLQQQGDLHGAAAQLAGALDHAQRHVASAPSVLAEQRMTAALAELRGRLALLRAQLGGAGAGWAVLAPAGTRPLAGDECLAASVRLGGDLALFFATRSDATFEVVPGAASREGAAGDLLERCGKGTRKLTLLDTPWSDVAAWAREVRRAHPAVAVVLAGDARTAWPVGTVEGPSLVVHSPRPVPPSRGLAFLYGAAREAAAIRAALPGAVELREEAANPAAVRANAGGKRLLHFAVHGQASLREGAASHLVLAGEDGLLQVIDVLDMPLAAARPVVVLSACSSGGRSADRENDGAGLAWAFLRAGARAVIAHQDALRDDVALAFSDAFYPALARGAGLSQAFEAALAHVRAEHGAEAAAGFLLSI